MSAKGNLSQLLERVAKGERITITKLGKPVAILVPVPQSKKPDLQQVIKDLIAYSKRQGRTLDRLTIRNMINKGRR